MSYQTPIDFNINNPVLADKAAQKIQKVLADNVSAWLSISYGRARIGKGEKNGVDITFPACQQTFGTDYIKVFPNDNVTAQSYILIQNETVEQIAEGKNIVNWTADCSIIIFIRKLNEIDTSYAANIEQKLREEIQEVLATRAGSFTMTGFSDEVEDAYAEFSVDSLNPKYINDHKAYAYLRFDGTVTYKADCFELYPYDGNVDFDPLQAYDFIYGGATFIQQP